MRDQHRQLRELLEDCHTYLALVRQAFATDCRPIETMQAFRILTKKVDSGDLDQLLINLDILLT